MASLLRRATLSEVCDAMVLSPRHHAPLFVLAGQGRKLRTCHALAQPRDFSINVKLAAGQRESRNSSAWRRPWTRAQSNPRRRKKIRKLFEMSD